MAVTPARGLASLVRAKYASARASGSVVFADSQLAIIDLGVNAPKYQLRFCPNLAKKPEKNDAQPKAQAKPFFDPFENPAKEQLVSEVPETSPSHAIVLNKFPIIANHFILATKANKPQDYLLEPDDLAQSYECVKEWTRSGGDRLYGFFNCGNASGASQPHRHLQFLPIEDMIDGSGWAPLIDSLDTGSLVQDDLRVITTLPFVHFGLRIPKHASVDVLFGLYLKLYMAAAASAQRYQDAHAAEKVVDHTHGYKLPISSNLAFTADYMIICPRRGDGLLIRSNTDEPIDFVAVNGTLLAGTCMVKNEQVFKLLQAEPFRLAQVLAAAGIPSGQGYEKLKSGDLDPRQYPELGNVTGGILEHL